MDLPGNGRHHHLSSPTSIPKATEFLREELKRTRPGPVFLFSISMGSMVAIDWASRFPDEVLGVVLINTSVKGLSPFYQRLRSEVWVKIFQMILLNSLSQREREILVLTANSAVANDPSVLKARVQAYEKHPVRKTNVFRQLFAALMFQPPIQRPNVPMLLLSSERDRLTHPSCGEAIARHWQLTRKVHPTAGHDLPLDDPAWTIDETKSWFVSLLSQRQG